MDAAMREWVVDQGNTRLKLGRFLDGGLAEVLVDAEAAACIHAVTEVPDRIVVAASGQLDEAVRRRLETLGARFLESREECGIGLDYATPATLGWDRIANAAAVTAMDPEAVWVVVDAGTCITVDVVSEGTFFGGSIAPGIDLRLRALYAGTAALPLIEGWRERIQDAESTWPEHVGTSTEGSLIAGAWGGARSEIAGRIQEFGKRWPGLRVIWTGGDADYLHERESGSIFADSNLTLKGYHAILQRLI